MATHPALASARKKIDALDARIAALLARRFALASGLGAFKEKVTDRARERAVLADAAKAAGREYAADVRAVFACVISRSKRRQRTK